MKFTVSDEIWNDHPELSITIVVANNLDNMGEWQEINDNLRQIEEQQRKILDKEKISEHPNIKVWKEAYSKFGGKPKKNKSSVESLLRRVLSDEELPQINKLVDIYNYISLKYIIPVGGDDLDKVDGNILLKKAKGDEKFIQLGSEEETHPRENEVVYMDDKNVLCRRWNWRESETSKLTQNTKNVIIYLESLTVAKLSETAAKELGELIKKFCNAEKINIFTLTKENKSAEL